MATIKLTDAAVKSLPAPAHGNKIHQPLWNLQASARQLPGPVRRATFSITGLWQPDRAADHNWPGLGWIIWQDGLEDIGRRERARALKIERDAGADPMGGLREVRSALTVNKLADAFEAGHLPTLRASTRRDYQGIIRQYIRPEFGALRLPDWTRPRSTHCTAGWQRCTRTGRTDW